MSGESTQDYMAFLSYRHADNSEEDRQWATWLHQQLEVYEIPADLIGTINLRGEVVPERIYPVFRDEVSLPANADLASSIYDALDRSQFLVVLCSPRAVQSRYVHDEILHFKKTGKADRIMAGILLGEPNASIDESKIEDPEDVRTLECFPTALQYHVGDDNELDLTSFAEPIAANFRLPDGGKGLTSASAYGRELLNKGLANKTIDAKVTGYEEQLNNSKLKIIAGILGLPLERLTQRDRLHQLNKARKSAKRFRVLALVLSVLTTASILSGIVAYRQWQEANRSFAEARGVVDEFITDISVDELADYPGLQPLRDRYSKQAVERYSAFLERDTNDKSVQIGYANALAARAGVLSSIGSAIEAESLYRESVDTTRFAVESLPASPENQLALAKRELELGTFFWEMERCALAVPIGVAAAERLEIWASKPKDEPETVFHLARIYNIVGLCRQETGNDGRAEHEYSYELANSVLEHSRNRSDVLQLLSAVANNISLIEKSAKNYQESLRLLNQSDEYLGQALKLNPNSPRLASDQAIGIKNRASTLKASGQMVLALSEYERATEALRSVSNANPLVTRYGWQLADNLRWSAALMTEMADYEGALQAYTQAEVLLEELTQRVDDRPHYGVALIKTHQSIARYYAGEKGGAKRDDTKWLEALDRAVDTAEQIAKKYPEHWEVQFSLSLAHFKRASFDEIINGDNDSMLQRYQLALDNYAKFLESRVHEADSYEISEYLAFAEAAVDTAKRLGRLDAAATAVEQATIAVRGHTGMVGLQRMANMLGIMGKIHSEKEQNGDALEYYQRALGIGLPAWEKSPWNWWLRQDLGAHYLDLYKIHRNMNNVADTFRAGQDWLKVWGQPMHGAAGVHLLDIDAMSATDEQHKELALLVEGEYGMTRFTIPTDFGGVQAPFAVYITNIPWPTDPLADQARWVKELRGGEIPEDVRESFRKLHKIAHDNNVLFTELAAYALGNAKNETSENEAAPIEEPAD